jgi:hypothetical protein
VKDQFSYQDFDLLIEPGTRGHYRARVLRSPAGESAPVQFTLPFSPMELENFVLKVGLARRGARGPGRPGNAPLKDFGGKLYGAVFQDELRDTLLRSLSLTSGPGMGLRLRLRLTGAPELADVPWEFLYDQRLNRFLVQSRRTPLVRYLDLPDPPHPLAVGGPLRLLVMISSPTGYPALDVEQEWSLLTEALAEQRAEGRVVIERLAANMGMLRKRLRREQFHVFHFVGHGLYRPDWGDGVLVMEDRDGRPREVTGDELGGLLSEYDQTRLAVLNACEGGRTGASDPFAGVAQSLIQQGLPAVVAMQFAITDDAAIIFAQELYGAIADGYPLEAALAEARGAIRDEGNSTEWGTPVLYSRAPDGQLFDVIARGPVSKADRRAQEEGDRAAVTPAARAYLAGPGPADTARRLGHEIPAASPPGPQPQARPRPPPAPSGPHTLAATLTHGSRWLTVHAVVFRPNGQLLASGCHDSKIQLWDPTKGQLVGTLIPENPVWSELTGPIYSVAFSPDGHLLASAGADMTVRLWDPVTGGSVRTLTGHTRGIWRVVFSPEGHLLASAGADMTVWLWDPVTGGSVRTLTGHTRTINALAFSPDGRLLASGSDDKTVRLWDPATGQSVRTLTGHAGWVRAVAFSPDGHLLASGSDDKTVQLWDPATGQSVRTLTGHAGCVRSVAFSPDGHLLASAGDEGTVRLWH